LKPILTIQEMLGYEYYDLMDEVLEDGYFYSGDDCCVGAVLYGKDWLLRQDIDKSIDKVWYVCFYAGDLKRVLELVPFETELIAFRRNFGKIKVYDMKKLLKRIGGK